jgi:hypothetical protein
MRVIDFGGREHNWPPSMGRVNKTAKKSDLHIRCRKILHRLYGTQPILEEVPIPVKTKLFLDFYLPLQQVAVECHGRQHYEFIPHFHGTRRAFVSSQQRDRDKAEWCNINNITLIILPYTETDSEWTTRLNN